LLTLNGDVGGSIKRPIALREQCAAAERGDRGITVVDNAMTAR
jgi:hypothetical protein